MFVYGIAVLDGMQSFQEKAFLPVVQVPFQVKVVICCFGVVPNCTLIVRRVLSKENISTTFKPRKTLSSIFKKPKDRPAINQIKGIVYIVKCKTCDFTYVGESKRSWIS